MSNRRSHLNMGYDNQVSIFDNTPVWDLPRKLSYFVKLGIGKSPTIKPKRLDPPTVNVHKEKLQAQFEKATADYYMRLTSVDQDRLRAYEDFDSMEYTPEIASALDIYADECLTENEWNDIIRVKTKNNRIKVELDRLFYDVLDVRRNLWSWTRAMCKYGNHYLLLDIDDKNNFGVVGHMSLPVKEIVREEAYDGNLNSVRFIWETINEEFDAWQVAHFRLLNDDKRFPYGTSILESARRIWKQLTLAEDAMIVYRLTRAPERRVFKIDVGNIDPSDVEQYMKKVKTVMKRTPSVEHTTGNVSFKYNVMSVDEDFFIPVRGDRSSNIETLPGASNMDEIADIEYLQQKMFAAMKIPKAFLTYEEDVNAKATLAGQDSRFARTIQRVQGAILSELHKIALIHLYSIGIRDRDQLADFDLELTNPNTALEQENLELLRTRGETLISIWNETSLSPISLVWGLRNIMNFTDQEIRLILKQQYLEGKINLKFEEQNTPDFEKEQQTVSSEISSPDQLKKKVLSTDEHIDMYVNNMIELLNNDTDESDIHNLMEDSNPLVKSNNLNNSKTIELLNSVDSLVSKRIKLSGVRKK